MEQQYPQGSGTINPSMMHTLQRHRDIHYDYAREYKKLKQSISQLQDHAELLSGPRQTRMTADDHASLLNNDPSMLLMQERRHLNQSHSMTDNVLDAAQSVKSALFQQRQSLYQSSSRMGSSVTSQLPSIGSLIQRIQVRRRRDSLILGLIAGICILLLLFYKFG